MLILAHAGHWLVSVAYFVPVVAFVVWLAWVTIKERREGDQGEDAGEKSLPGGE